MKFLKKFLKVILTIPLFTLSINFGTYFPSRVQPHNNILLRVNMTSLPLECLQPFANIPSSNSSLSFLYPASYSNLEKQNCNSWFKYVFLKLKYGLKKPKQFFFISSFSDLAMKIHCIADDPNA